MQDNSQKISDELDGLDVTMRNGELIIAIPNKILFASGKATLNSSAKSTLNKIVNVIQRDYAGRFVRVEGHTDSDPIKRSSWKDNWDLSGARARSVLLGLISAGLDANLSSFAGYGETRPKADNSSKSGKAKNRRVEVVILAQGS